LKQGTVVSQPTGESVRDAEPDPKKHGVGKTVLVVDDNAPMRRMIAAAFLSDGFKTCAEADNGQEGIMVAKRIMPDLITLDLSMPLMNGLEAAPELRKLFPKTPIILFSLYGEEQLESEASRAGINLVLSKAEPLSKLVKTAHALMGVSSG
jgi:two-component system chemotaxis response regulator CheY